MDRFQEALKTDLGQKERETIAQQMLADTVKPKSKILQNLNNYDWDRAEFADPRDPRCTSIPCEGAHQLEGFGKGSLTGCNKHGLWLVCSQCRLRVLYVPTTGAKAIYRSSGPLASDVKTKVVEMAQGKDVNPNDLRTQALGLDAAEQSTIRRLKQIQDEKAKVKGKTGPTTASKGAMATSSEVIPKKTPKRDHEVPPEAQEKEDWTDLSKD